VAIAACSSSPAPKTRPGALPGSVAAASAASHAPRHRGYRAARREWLAEGRVVGGAGQGLLLEMAVTDLQHGELADPENRSEYPAIIAALRNFMDVPDSEDTPAQVADLRADVAKIDKFFRLSGNRGCNHWPSTRKACWGAGT
jgi:hypothetical protein